MTRERTNELCSRPVEPHLLNDAVQLRRRAHRRPEHHHERRRRCGEACPPSASCPLRDRPGAGGGSRLVTRRGGFRDGSLDRRPGPPQMPRQERRHYPCDSTTPPPIRAAEDRDLRGRPRVPEHQPLPVLVNVHRSPAPRATRRTVPPVTESPLMGFEVEHISRDHCPSLLAGRVRATEARFGLRRRRSMVGHGRLSRCCNPRVSHLLRFLSSSPVPSRFPPGIAHPLSHRFPYASVGRTLRNDPGLCGMEQVGLAEKRSGTYSKFEDPKLNANEARCPNGSR